MARRKKEPQSVHRRNISEAAGQLFQKKGIENTSMSEIAKEAGYSKATLYVYFQNKEELVGVLILESMQKLRDDIGAALGQSTDTWKRYRHICDALLRYQEEYPFYFRLTLETINVDFSSSHFLPEEKETFLVGEQINGLLLRFLEEGSARGELRPDIEPLPTIFSFWGMLAGFLRLAENKEAYIGGSMGKSKAEFLEYGFEMLYRAVCARSREREGV